MECFNCNWECSKEDFSCVKDISFDQVADVVVNQLKMKSVQVGWAYIPSSHSFECAIISGA